MAVKKETVKKRVKIDKDELIPVISNFGGSLHYKSVKSQYEEVWDESGQEIDMEYGELESMRNTQKTFFINNWITLGSTDEYTAEQIYEALNVSKYYANNGLYNSIDDIFGWTTTKIKKEVPNLPKPVKETLLTKIYTMLADEDERLDSTAKKKAFSEALDINFDEVI